MCEILFVVFVSKDHNSKHARFTGYEYFSHTFSCGQAGHAKPKFWSSAT